jgi:hypothetical protein
MNHEPYMYRSPIREDIHNLFGVVYRNMWEFFSKKEMEAYGLVRRELRQGWFENEKNGPYFFF